MHKKESDLHEKIKGGLRIIRRGLLSKNKILDNDETATKNIASSNKAIDDFKKHGTIER